MFTQEQINEIKSRLAIAGKKDTELPIAGNLKAEDIMAVVQNGENKQITVEEFQNALVTYLENTERIDLFNVSRYAAKEDPSEGVDSKKLTLAEAIDICPDTNRRGGQIITFLDKTGEWALWQYIGEDDVDWYDIDTKWVNIGVHKNLGITFTATPTEIPPNTYADVAFEFETIDGGRASYVELIKQVGSTVETIQTWSDISSFNYTVRYVYDTTTFTLNVRQYGREYTETIKVPKSYSAWKGSGETYTDIVLPGNEFVITDSADGTYTIDFSSGGSTGKRLVFFIPSAIELGTVTMNGFVVPIQKSDLIEYERLYYYEYKSVNHYTDGSYIFDVGEHKEYENDVLAQEILGVQNKLGDVETTLKKVTDTTADKKQDDKDFTGYGRVVLEKNIQEYTEEYDEGNVHHTDTVTTNILTQDALPTDPKYIIVIQYDFDLDGKEIVLPEDCILEFNGGSLNNGTLICGKYSEKINDSYVINKESTCSIIAPAARIFGDTLKLKGSFPTLKLEWFGIIGTNDDNTKLFRGLKDRLEVIDAEYFGIQMFNFEFDSDIVFKYQETYGFNIRLPRRFKLNGKNNKLRFLNSPESDIDLGACIYINERNILSEIQFEADSTFNGAVIEANTSKRDEGFDINAAQFRDIQIRGSYSGTTQGFKNNAKLIGMRFIATNVDAPNDGKNHITNHFLSSARMEYVKIGIYIEAKRIERTGDVSSVWCNDFQFDYLYIHCAKHGIVIDNEGSRWVKDTESQVYSGASGLVNFGDVYIQPAKISGAPHTEPLIKAYNAEIHINNYWPWDVKSAEKNKNYDPTSTNINDPNYFEYITHGGYFGELRGGTDLYYEYIKRPYHNYVDVVEYGIKKDGNLEHFSVLSGFRVFDESTVASVYDPNIYSQKIRWSNAGNNYRLIDRDNHLGPENPMYTRVRATEKSVEFAQREKNLPFGIYEDSSKNVYMSLASLTSSGQSGNKQNYDPELMYTLMAKDGGVLQIGSHYNGYVDSVRTYSHVIAHQWLKPYIANTIACYSGERNTREFVVYFSKNSGSGVVPSTTVKSILVPTYSIVELNITPRRYTDTGYAQLITGLTEIISGKEVKIRKVSVTPTSTPTVAPTPTPSETPTEEPTEVPTTVEPTAAPTDAPIVEGEEVTALFYDGIVSCSSSNTDKVEILNISVDKETGTIALKLNIKNIDSALVDSVYVPENRVSVRFTLDFDPTIQDKYTGNVINFPTIDNEDGLSIDENEIPSLMPDTVIYSGSVIHKTLITNVSELEGYTPTNEGSVVLLSDGNNSRPFIYINSAWRELVVPELVPKVNSGITSDREALDSPENNYIWFDTTMKGKMLAYVNNKWKDALGYKAAPSRGTWSNKPTSTMLIDSNDNGVGFMYYATDKNKPVFFGGVDSQDNEIWYDAMGNLLDSSGDIVVPVTSES